jgi:hypothetical protein
MDPLAQTLVLMVALLGSISHITDIPNRNVRNLVLLAEAYDLATGLVQDIASLAREPYRRLGLASAQALHPAALLLALAHLPVIRCMPLVTQALHGAQITPSDAQAVASLGHNRCDVDLSQVYAGRRGGAAQAGQQGLPGAQGLACLTTR